MPDGVVILLTGDGKGKTTSALGQCFRALGHGWKVCFLQFIKGEWETGEKKLAMELKGRLFFKPMGKGFTWEGDLPVHEKAAREAWRFARERVMSGEYRLIVLDELTWLIYYGIIAEEDVLELVRERPSKVSLVITGRKATEGLKEISDIVSEIMPVKFPAGKPAVEGIEY